MLDDINSIAEGCAVIVEMIGIGVITLTAFFVLIYTVIRVFRKDGEESIYHRVRQLLGRGIILGLEFLVAADIIHTVVVELTFSTVGVLALIVLIRTFLSFTLEVELTGRWPWQKAG